MSTQEPDLRRLEPLVDILAYFAAARNYGYVDALTNALDPATALDAVVNAVRDFKSSCVDRKPEEEEVRCPKVDLKRLEDSLKYFEESVARLGSGGELVLLLKRLALRALARSHEFKVA